MAAKYPMNEAYVFVIETETGHEGILCAPTTAGMLPFFACELERVAQLLPLARNLAGLSRKPFRILKFSTREDVTQECLQAAPQPGPIDFNIVP